AIRIAADGRLLASAGKDQTVRLWRLETMQQLHLCRGQEGEICSLAFSPDGRNLASGAAQHCAIPRIHLWQVATGKEVSRFDSGSAAVAFLPGSRSLIGVSKTGIARVWEIATGKDMRHFRVQQLASGQVAFAPDGKTMATGPGNTIRLWDMAT